MSLDEVFTDNPPITRAQALRCLREHNCDDLDQFFAELGNTDTYSSKEVLEFLGY